MARKKQETLVLFPDVCASTAKFTDAQFGALMRAVFRYRFDGIGYDGDDLLVDMAFGFIKTQLDRYREVCETNRKNKTGDDQLPAEDNEVQPSATECNEIQRNTPHTHTHSHTHNRNHTHTHNHTHIQTHSLISSPDAEMAEKADTVSDTETNGGEDFIAPSLAEVATYAREQKIFQANPVTFYFHYEQNGWQDQTGKPIKDWKALLHHWNQTEVPPTG